MKQDPRTIINTNEDHTFNLPAYKKVIPRTLDTFSLIWKADKVDTRVRGRQVSLKIENEAVDETWRYGTLRLDIEAGGRR